MATATQVQQWFSVSEARSKLNCSEKRVRRLYNNNELTGDRNGRGGSRRISRESLIAYMKANSIPLGELADPVDNGDTGGGTASE